MVRRGMMEMIRTHMSTLRTAPSTTGTTTRRHGFQRSVKVINFNIILKCQSLVQYKHIFIYLFFVPSFGLVDVCKTGLQNREGVCVCR